MNDNEIAIKCGKMASQEWHYDAWDDALDALARLDASIIDDKPVISDLIKQLTEYRKCLMS